jgi:hypothetical protein
MNRLDKYFTITELTREFGISTRTLRFYEDEGLIHPERRGRTRLFRAADRRLIQEICVAAGSASRLPKSARSSRFTGIRLARPGNCGC